jgi:hypothetical protein
VWALLLAAMAATAGGVAIDADFPGGNVILDRIDPRDVFLHQDLRDTSGTWFYWHFRVSGAAGRTLAFHFTRGKVLGPQGPCYSLDRGLSWQWLGPTRTNTSDTPPEDGFGFRFSADAAEVRFCVAIPYQESDLARFLARHPQEPALRAATLCTTAKLRAAELLYLGRMDDRPRYRLAFTCRHHACESVASYVLEGLMEAVLADDATGRWYRRETAIVVLPMMDKDGVEAGDQGKNRKPHDHNRDYAGESIYATVAAVKKLLPAWSQGKLDMAIDLHCPVLGDSLIQFIGGPQEDIWQRTLQLSKTLESIQKSPLRHDSQRNVPFGTSWNREAARKTATFSGWASSLPGIRIATTIEMPYSQVMRTPVTADAARQLGRDLAEAIKIYLEQEAGK